MNRQMPLAVEPAPHEINGLPPQRGFSVSDIMILLVHRRWIILCISLLVCVIGTYAASRLPVTYTARASVALNPSIDLDKAVLGERNSQIDVGVVESEIEVIKSRTLVERVVDDQGLAAVKAWLSDSQPIIDREAERVRQTDAIIRSISVLRKQSSYVIDIEASAQTPYGATAISNALADAYLASRVDSIAQGVDISERQRQSQLESLRLELERRNKAVSDFTTSRGLAPINGSTMGEQMILETQRNLTESRNKLYELETQLSKLEAAKATGGATDLISEIDASPVLNQLRIRESQLRGKVADLREIYGPQHPESITANSELRDIIGQIELEVSMIGNSLERSAQSARRRVAELEQELRSRQASLNVDERARAILAERRQEAETTAQIYRDMLLKSQDLNDRTSRQTDAATLLSRAVVPRRPSSPPLALWAAFFAGAGLFLGLSVAVVKNLLSNKILRTEDIERFGAIRALVAIPELKGHRSGLSRFGSRRAPSDYISQKPFSEFAESFRMVVTEIAMRVPSDKGRVVAITSAMAGEGKTTSSQSIGKLAAMSGMRVAIIDCDVRKQVRLDRRKCALPEGIVPLLQPEGCISSAFVEDKDIDSLHIFPVGSQAIMFEHSVLMKRLWSLLDPLRERYDLILLDCAPVLAVADTRLVTAAADATIVVCRWNRTPLPALNITLEQINRAGGSVLGVVMNAVETSVARHYSFADTLYFGRAGKGYYIN